MLLAINVPQTKTVSIAYTSLKSMIFGLILTITLRQISNSSNNNECTESIITFTSLLEVLFLLGLILDVFALLYFFFKQQFKIMEYYVFYAFHVIMAVLCVVGCVHNLSNYSGCDVSDSYFYGVLCLSLVFQVNTLIAMSAHLYFILKYLHFGSNIVWTIIWLNSLSCTNIFSSLVAIIHGLLACIGLFNLILQRLQGKTTATAKRWRVLTIISFFSMILCYLLILIGALSPDTCEQAIFFQRSYQRYGLFQLISPLLILIFLRGESGNPRQKIIKSYDQVFKKLHENEFIETGARI